MERISFRLILVTFAFFMAALACTAAYYGYMFIFFWLVVISTAAMMTVFSKEPSADYGDGLGRALIGISPMAVLGWLAFFSWLTDSNLLYFWFAVLGFGVTFIFLLHTARVELALVRQERGDR